MLFELVSSGSFVEQEVRLPTQPSPVGVCRAAHLIESKGRGKRHAQDSSRVLGMIAEPTGTDGRPVIPKHTGVTGRHNRPGFLFHLPVSSFSWLHLQERIVQGASTAHHTRIGRLGLV